MTALDLYKFIQARAVEWKHAKNDQGEADVLIMPDYDELQAFMNMTGFLVSEEPLAAALKETYACIWMRDICERCDIDLYEVFPKGDE